MKPAISINNLKFGFDDHRVFDRLSFDVPLHSRCLLLGANGVGKSTLLRILAGKHLIPQDSVTIFGENPFSGSLSARDFTLVADRFPFDYDITVAELLERSRPATRLQELIDLLGVDVRWRMHRVSNGQRRRVDLLLSFMTSPKLVLLDEVTSDLDILSRQDLLRWLKAETDAGRMTVIFATHILDGMHSWASHVAFLSPGRLRAMAEIDKLLLIDEARAKNPESPLLWLTEKWLREDVRGEK